MPRHLLAGRHHAPEQSEEPEQPIPIAEPDIARATGIAAPR
jgi:hypothetical protein